MKSSRSIRLPCALFALAGFALSAAAGQASAARARILCFTKSSGFEHDAIKLRMADGRRGYAFPVLEALGEKHGIEFVFSKDGSRFTPDYLAGFDAFFFYTSGELTRPRSDPRGDGLPPMTAAGKQALLDAVAGGKGFVGVHSATDSFHSFGRNGHVPERFLDDGAASDDYVKMIGGEFIRHARQQQGRQVVVDAKFPGMAAVPADYAPFEEWYSLKNFAPDMHVLMVQDTAGMVGAEYARPPYPSTWARREGKGRVFYTSLGHREDVWNSPVFQSLLEGGIAWVLGRVEADVTPNLAKTAPGANEMPVYEPPRSR